MRQGRIRDVQEALLVDRDHPLPFLDVGADDGGDDGGEKHETGVVDQNVQAPETVDHGLHGTLGLGPVGDVGLHRESGAADSFDLGTEGVDAVFASRDGGDGSAVLGETACGRLADAAAGARDDGDRAGSVVDVVVIAMSFFLLSGGTCVGRGGSGSRLFGSARPDGVRRHSRATWTVLGRRRSVAEAWR